VKTCPYCAEQIPEDALRCPYCQSDLTEPAGAAPVTASATAPASHPARRVVGEGALAFSHSGTTYLLGWGTTFFGIWNRNVPGGPQRTFPRTDEGWREAWLEFTRIESNFVPVTQSS
jgi:hypothetical protein